MKRAIEGGAAILDARPGPRFRGEAAEPRPGLKSGHMPGALNVPSGSLVGENGQMKSREELTAIFAAAGATNAKAPICTCGSGITAAIVALALARSPAFEVALTERGAPPRGPVVLFAAQVESDTGSFRGQLTFVQGHRAFYPDVNDPAQLGVVAGVPGEIAPERPLLGYVVLPPDYDPSQEMEIFWHDRQLHTTLSPAS